MLWLHLPSSPKRVIYPFYLSVSDLIIMGRTESLKYFGKEPAKIIVHFNREQIQWLIANDQQWLLSCISFNGDIDNHYAPDKLIQFSNEHSFLFPLITSYSPLENALIIFTDGSANGKAVYHYKDNTVILDVPTSSTQITELHAVFEVLKQFADTTVNIYSDSHYVVHSVPFLETLGNFKSDNPTAPILFSVCGCY